MTSIVHTQTTPIKKFRGIYHMHNAPINVNPVGGGVRARGGDLTEK